MVNIHYIKNKESKDLIFTFSKNEKTKNCVWNFKSLYWMLNCQVIWLIGLSYLLEIVSTLKQIITELGDHCLTKNLFKFYNTKRKVCEIFKVSGRYTGTSLTSPSCPFCWHGTNITSCFNPFQAIVSFNFPQTKGFPMFSRGNMELRDAAVRKYSSK